MSISDSEDSDFSSRNNNQLSPVIPLQQALGRRGRSKGLSLNIMELEEVQLDLNSKLFCSTFSLWMYAISL